MRYLFSTAPLRHFALAASLLTPIALMIVPGCGGGGNSPFKSTTSTTLPTTLLNLGNGQSALLALTRRGDAISGTVTISTPPTAAKTAAAISFQIPIGPYSVSGSFNDDGTFHIGGNFPAPLGTFNFSGLFPTQTTAGNFTFTAGGETVSDTLPALGGTVPTGTPTGSPTATPTGSPTATPTATRTATPTPIGGTPTPTPAPGISRVQNIVITPGAGFNGTTRPTLLSGPTPNFNNFTTFGAPSNQLGGDTNLVFEGPSLNRPARVGDTFNLQNQSAFVGILYYAEAVASGPERGWESTGGTMRVTAVTDSSVSFTLTNVTFAPRSFGTTSATGNFTLSGDGVFNG